MAEFNNTEMKVKGFILVNNSLVYVVKSVTDIDIGFISSTCVLSQFVGKKEKRER